MSPRQEKNAREKKRRGWGLQGVVVFVGSLFVLWEAPLCLYETSPPA